MPPSFLLDCFLNLITEIAASGGRMILDMPGTTLARAAGSGTSIFPLKVDPAEASELSGPMLVRIEDVAAFARGDRGSRGHRARHRSVSV